jgi:hypothetical protein
MADGDARGPVDIDDVEQWFSVLAESGVRREVVGALRSISEREVEQSGLGDTLGESEQALLDALRKCPPRIQAAVGRHLRYFHHSTLDVPWAADELRSGHRAWLQASSPLPPGRAFRSARMIGSSQRFNNSNAAARSADASRVLIRLRVLYGRAVSSDLPKTFTAPTFVPRFVAPSGRLASCSTRKGDGGIDRERAPRWSWSVPDRAAAAGEASIRA